MEVKHEILQLCVEIMSLNTVSKGFTNELKYMELLSLIRMCNIQHKHTTVFERETVIKTMSHECVLQYLLHSASPVFELYAVSHVPCV